VIALRWEWIAIGYYAYLLVLALAIKRFARARTAAFAGTIAGVVVVGAQSLVPLGPTSGQLTFWLVIPLVILLAGYRLSGLFFIGPMQAVERWLMAIDDRLLRRPGILAAYDAGPRIVRELFETAYVLVYPVIPAAAATLAIGGHLDAVPRFWATVLLAEFVSYGMLPWLQTRPPRALESAAGVMHPPSAVRQFNAAILSRGSIQVNTVPSGHAAGAVATALAVADVMPVAGIVFALLAAAIVAATVLGRYHYLVDSLLGALVALSAWLICR
jgi:membrane-associated phospholipid phosphatase